MRYQSADRLLECLNAAGMTQAQLSRATGVSAPYISALIRGDFRINEKTANRLKVALPGLDFEARPFSEKSLTFRASESPAAKAISNLMKVEKLDHIKLANKINIASSRILTIVSGKTALSMDVAKRIQNAYPDFEAKKVIESQNEMIRRARSTVKPKYQWMIQQLQS